MMPTRVSTIVWGVVLLLVAASSFAFIAWDVEAIEGFTLVHVVVGLGALLVLAALVGAIAQLTRRPAPAPTAPAAAPAAPPAAPAAEVAETVGADAPAPPAPAVRATSRARGGKKDQDQPVD